MLQLDVRLSNWKPGCRRAPTASLGSKSPYFNLETRLHHLVLKPVEMRPAYRGLAQGRPVSYYESA